MQIVYDDGTARREIDVRISDPGATVADLAAALGADGTDRRLLIGDTVATADLGLTECGLHEGASVRLVRSWRPAATPSARLTLDVVGGLDAGRRLPLRSGPSIVGRDPACDLVLDSDTLSRQHAELSVDDTEIVVRDLGSLNGTWVDGRPVTSEASIAVDQLVQVGSVQVAVRPQRTADRPAVVDLRRQVNASGTIPFNRPPRPARPPELDRIEAPEAPRDRGKGIAFNVVAVVAPLLLAGVFYVTTEQVAFLLMTLLSPVMVLGNWVQGKVQGRRGSRQEHARFAAALDTFRARLTTTTAEESRRRHRSNPDAAEIARRALLPSTRLWERRPHDDDFLVLRAGLGDVPWTPPVDGADKDAAEEVTTAIRTAGVLARCPVTVGLSDGGVVGIVGQRPAVLALARSLVCQAAVHHGPADLPMAVLGRPETVDDWDWAKWLPHTRDPSDGAARWLSPDSAWSDRFADRWLAQLARQERGGDRARPRGPTLLLVVDDESLTEGRRAPVRTLLGEAGGAVAGIVIASSPDRLPAVCTTVVEVHGRGGEASLAVPRRGEQLDGFLVAGVADDTARACARALARFEDPELAVAGAGLPDLVRLLPLLEFEGVDADAVLTRWKSAGAEPPPRTPVGVADDGAVFSVDLHTDGPHGLVGGTTGSGKSELLRTLVAGLAANVDPDHLTFVLIDFKGGSAFDECGRLPHTVGLVTDLDEHLAERALRCLEAELKHRERVLRDAAVTDLPAYLRSGATEPLPRLLVVIDEFATLKAELPDFVDALVGVAQRGRSLGVHLLLATQRPSGAVSENIRANTNLRIALRVQDDGDSTDIIDRPDAARLPRSAAGRAYVRLGAGEVVTIQTALATAARSDGGEAASVTVAPFRYGPGPHPSGRDGDDQAAQRRDDHHDSDLRVLVDAITEAHLRTGRPAPRRPWPDPLPPVIDLDELLSSASAVHGPEPEVVFALADDPDRQTQHASGWVPEQGNLLVFGLVGAGTTTVLRTVALSLAWSYPADRLHLYALDFGTGELAELEGLPHTGAIIAAAERERQVRLVRFLGSELDRRRSLPPEVQDREPAIVVLVDGFAAFTGEHRDLAGMDVLDEFQRVFADGSDVAIYFVVTADRPGAVPMAMTSLVRQKLVMRLADRFDYSQFGIPSKDVPELRPGRAILAETKRVIHVATPADGTRSAAERFARLHASPTRRPPAIGQLPGEITLAELGAVADLGDRSWRIPIGIGDSALGTAFLDVHDGEHVLVAGPARSGKTSALATIAEACRAGRRDLSVITIAPPRSPLSDMVNADRHLRAGPTGAEPGELTELAAPTLLLIDDAEAIDDDDMVLDGLLAAHRRELLVVAAGRADGLRGTFSHWTRAVRRSKLGLLLQPAADLDGELLGVDLPRRPTVAMSAGRGFLVSGGDVDIVQVARPTAPATATRATRR